MSQYGSQAYPAQMRSAPSAAGYMPQMQQQPPMASGASSYQQPYKGTLAPGTRVKVGNITVTVKRYLSEGGFAHVYLVTTTQPIPMPSSVTGSVGASAAVERGETVHVLKRMAVPDKAALADVRREVEVHKLLRNQPNIVHFIEASATALQGGGYEIFILMEYCSGGGIISLMNARLRDRLREEEVLKIFGDVCAGVAVMHHLDPPLMHRDLKVENILMAPSTDPGSIPGSRSTASNLKATFKLCDFGSAAPVLSRKPPKSMDEVKRVEADLNKHTTLQYRAPEMVDVYQRRIIDEKADIWALGVFLYKLCYYTTPFEENGGGPLAILNVQYRIPPQPVYSDKIKALIQSLLKEQSTDRPSIDQVIVQVHNILGTRPPQSATHYATAAASGRIPTALPTLVSTKGGKAGIGGVDGSLISKGPSRREVEEAEKREMELQKQSIVPMRRGRPAKPADSPAKKVDEETEKKASSPAPAPNRKEANWTVPDQKKSAEVPLIEGFGDSSSKESKWTVPTQNKPAEATLIEGFGDSFSPSTPIESPPTLPKRPSPTTLSPDPTSETKPTLLRAEAVTPLRHSPALPGFSPAPSPHPPSSSRDELTDRFPSLEDLDARYSTPTTSAPASTNTTGGINVPGLANRASVGAMAGRFERPFEPAKPRPLNKSATISTFSSSERKGSVGSVGKRWQPSVIAHDKLLKEPQSIPQLKKTEKDWLTGDDTADDPPSNSVPSKPSPPAPITTANEAQELEVDEPPSSDEDEPPEAPEAVRKPSLPPRLTLLTEKIPTSTTANGATPVRPRAPGRVKAPSWLVDAVDSPGAAERLMSSNSTSFSALKSPTVVTDGEAAERLDEEARRAQDQLEELLRGPSAVEVGVEAADTDELGAVGDADGGEERSASAVLGDADRSGPLVDADGDGRSGRSGQESGGMDGKVSVADADGGVQRSQQASLVDADNVDGGAGVGAQRSEDESQRAEDVSPSVPSAAVRAPAWDHSDDEDSREMSSLPKPSLVAGNSSDRIPSSTSANAGRKEGPPVVVATKPPMDRFRSSSISNTPDIAAGGRSNGPPPVLAPKPAKEQLVDVSPAERSNGPPPVLAPKPSMGSTKELVDVSTSPTLPSASNKFRSLSISSNPSPNPSAPLSTAPRPNSIVAQRSSHFSPSPILPPNPNPTPHRPTPIRASKGLKPWERESALLSASTQGGITKSTALPPASTALHSSAPDDSSGRDTSDGAAGVCKEMGEAAGRLAVDMDLPRTGEEVPEVGLPLPGEEGQRNDALDRGR